MAEITGVVKDALIASLERDGKKISLLSGTIVEDCRGRFNPGNWFCSSVVEKVDGHLVHTRNSIYEVEGELNCEDVTLEEMMFIRNGVSLPQARALIENGLTPALG